MPAAEHPAWLSPTQDGVLLEVRVSPRASRNAIEPADSSRLRIRVTSAPERGKANAAVTKLLAKRLGVANSACRVVRGSSARDKRIEVAGRSADEVIDALFS
jgi:uncharacterized protein (TIGR00251 family)